MTERDKRAKPILIHLPGGGMALYCSNCDWSQQMRPGDLAGIERAVNTHECQDNEQGAGDAGGR